VFVRFCGCAFRARHGTVRYQTRIAASVKSKLYLSMDLTIVLSTDIQTWHDYNAFQFLIQQHNALQCEQIGMPHHHESCIRKFLILHGWVGPPWVARAACAEVSTGSVKAKHGPRKPRSFWQERPRIRLGLHMEPSMYGRLYVIALE
jgi:hypothetical protein